MQQPQRMIPPHVTLRTIREAQGLTSPMLADRIKERGVKISADHLLNVELGYKKGSNALMVAWANVLGLNPRDIRQDEDLRAVISEVDGNGSAA
jgi:hypothetical protein